MLLKSSTAGFFVGLAFTVVQGAPPASGPLQNILQNTHHSPSYRYPTDLTRDIIPKPVHSHNDYWRTVPFYSALAAGCISIEADVWLYDDVLYVGHDQSSLTPLRTFESLYIEPILDVLRGQNPTNEFLSEPTRNGVFDTSTSQTLYLFVDLKTDGHKTWPRVVEALQPLRDAGYLTRVENNETYIPGPVTVIGTGNTPLDLVAPVADRDYFFDAPLAELDSPKFKDITRLISPIASTSFARAVGDLSGDDEEFLDTKQLETIRSQISTAKERNIGARYWQTPGWPIRLRNAVWRTLLREGVALLNVDDLEATEEYF
ncbi:hypothetical protein VTO42DRAFT_6400 [Malbranchea cinnamomea]